VVIVDMSLAEQTAYITRLSWEFGLASILGFLLLGGLLYVALRTIVTKPIGRLAGAVGLISQRKYDVEVPQPLPRVPGTPIRDEVSELIDGFNLMAKVIESHEKELKRMVVLDELTGVYNLSHLREHLDRELGKSKRYKHPTSLILIDVLGIESCDPEDRDEVLIRTATFLVSNLRNVDLIFRVTDFRFAALLPETPAEGAAVAAERLRVSAPDVTSHFEFPVSLEISSSGWSGEGTPSVDEVLARITGREDIG
jgi:diguanylate cyclase (GGDEF)-like protein